MKQRLTKAFPILLALLLFAAALSFGALAEDEGPALDGAVTMGVDISSHFPDAAFQKYVRENIDANGDGTLSAAEMNDVKAIACQQCGIGSLTGLSHFKNLESLNCLGNALTELDVSQNTALKTLNCSINQLTALDVSNNTALTALNCSINRLTALDVNQNTALKDLSCSGNGIEALDVSQNTALTTLYCDNNPLAALDVRANTRLLLLHCSGNRLGSLDVSQNTALMMLYCSGNELSALDVSGNAALTTLDCGSNPLGTLDVSKNAALDVLVCAETSLEALSVRANTELTTLDCSGNALTALDVSKNPYLYVLKCQGNRIATLDLSGCEWLVDAVTQGKLSTSDGVAEYSSPSGRLWADAATALVYPVTDTGVEISKANFPDDVFRAFVTERFDTDEDGRLSAAETRAVESIDLSGLAGTRITDLTGVGYFPSLTVLDCSGQALQALDVSRNDALQTLCCQGNQLTELLLGENVLLDFVDCSANDLTALDITGCPALLDAVRNGEERPEGGIATYGTLTDGVFTAVLICDEAASIYIGGSVSVLGDLDGDGAVDARDAAILLGILFRGEDLPANADVTQNGTVTLLDVVQMLRFHTGLTTDMASVSNAGE